MMDAVSQVVLVISRSDNPGLTRLDQNTEQPENNHCSAKYVMGGLGGPSSRTRSAAAFTQHFIGH